MISLSLNPSFNHFRIMLPKELIPDAIYQKWYDMLNGQDKNFFREPIDIINESIQGVDITGVSDAGVEQEQNFRNDGTGRIEPVSRVTYRSTANPISLMNNELTITFRHVTGFYNYFLLFESWFHHHAKTEMSEFAPYLALEVMGEDNVVVNHLIFRSPVFTAIDSLSFSFDKVDRNAETFTCTFRYSDIDFELGPVNKS